MRRPVELLLCIVLVAASFAGCSRHKVIPKKEMVDIYAEMFLADQWMQETRQRGRMADTTLFYEPIFNRRGYTTYDFRRSVNYYLKDPERYARMLKKTSSKLGARADELKKALEGLEGYKKQKREYERAYVPLQTYYEMWQHDSLKLRDDKRLIDTLDSLIRTALDPVVYFEPAVEGMPPQEEASRQDSLEKAFGPVADTAVHMHLREMRNLRREMPRNLLRGKVRPEVEVAVEAPAAEEEAAHE